MIGYALRRLLGALPLVLGTATLVFIVIHLAPGDPTSVLLHPGMSSDVVERMRASFGLDEPLGVQYVKWITSLAGGDLGWSWSHRRPVASVLAGVLPNTLLLSGAALLLSFAFGVALGVVQAVKHHSLTDRLVSVVSLFFYSMPSFWLAVMMILAFSWYARTAWGWPVWFPVSGTRSIDYDLLGPGGRVADRLWHLTLPAVTLTLVLAAGIARYTRGSMLEVLGQDYIRTARARGLPEHVVVLRHALRNALLPVVTLLGLYLPLLFTGTVFVEWVFAWPGMGWTLVAAIGSRDYPLILGASLGFAVIVVVGNLLADLLYAVVDPRVRHG